MSEQGSGAAPDATRSNFNDPRLVPPPTQSVLVEVPVMGVAMTNEHYSWVKRQIRAEVRGAHTSSVWMALALSMLTVVGALLIVVTSTPDLSAATKHGYEEAAWFLGVIALIFVVFHVVMRKDAGKRAEELIVEMDLHTHRVAVSNTQTPSAIGAERPMAQALERPIQRIGQSTWVRERLPPRPRRPPPGSGSV